MRLLLAIAAVIAWLAAAQVASAQLTAHPLAGKIVETRSGAVTDITDPALIPKLFPCGAITLLGEVHDNAEHHRMRASLLEIEKSEGGEMRHNCGSAAFVFEHITADQQSALNEFWRNRQSSHGGTAESLLGRLQWDKSGWPSSAMFTPLFQQALRPGSSIIPGNPGREATRNVAKQGVGALDPIVARKIKLNEALPSALHEALLDELEASHCGLMPKTAFGNMATAQRYRDANMADVALAATADKGNILVFAGNGHVRADRGVPWYIRQRAPDRIVVTVAYVETEDGKTDPIGYGPKDPTGKPATDYVAFAPPAQREDPCEQMRKHMKKP